MSDNPLGPAVWIGLLTDYPELLPDSTIWTDTYRLPPAASYYYWLDYDAGSFADQRAPQGLFPATNVPVSVTGSSFSGFSPPWITSVTDVPFDRGGSVTINWSAANGYEDADAFNIYRHSYPSGQPGYDEWRFIASVSTLTSTLSYVDNGAVTSWVNQYKVSTAHHGNFELEIQLGDGNTGIWNSFSSVVQGPAIDNFAIDQITLLSPDTLRVCPAGDDGTLQVEEIIWGSALNPTVGIPPAMLECYVQDDSVFFCRGNTLIVDTPTDATGRTTLTTKSIGGHGRTDLIFGLANSFTRFDTLTVYVKSPDENGDGYVNVADMAAFATTFGSPPKTYKWYRDFVSPPAGKVNLADFAFWGSHYNHHCSSNPQSPVVSAGLTDTDVQLELLEVVSATDSRTLQANVSITNAQPFSATFIALRSDHPALKFARWDQGTYPGRVLVAPIVRDGVNEIAIGVLDGQKLGSKQVSLGRLVFDVTTGEDLVLRSQDFETRAADMLTVSGTIGAMGSASSGGSLPVKRVVANALAQNHPNPFNPTTTISYSIQHAGQVQLSIFSVNGSLVRTLVDDNQAPDSYNIIWDGADNSGRPIASGIYFYRLNTAGFKSTKKMVLLK